MGKILGKLGKNTGNFEGNSVGNEGYKGNIAGKCVFLREFGDNCGEMRENCFERGIIKIKM